MVLENEKVPENKKLRRLENQSPAHRAYGPEGKSEAPRYANLLTFPPSHLLIFQNICVYSFSSVVSLILFSFSYFWRYVKFRLNADPRNAGQARPIEDPALRRRTMFSI